MARASGARGRSRGGLGSGWRNHRHRSAGGDRCDRASRRRERRAALDEDAARGDPPLARPRHAAAGRDSGIDEPHARPRVRVGDRLLRRPRGRDRGRVGSARKGLPGRRGGGVGGGGRAGARRGRTCREPPLRPRPQPSRRSARTPPDAFQAGCRRAGGERTAMVELGHAHGHDRGVSLRARERSLRPGQRRRPRRGT